MKRTIVAMLLLLLLTGCNVTSKKKNTIKVGASSTPHALILEQTREYLKTRGYELEIVVFDDYVLPNLALENDELDANYFQHVPYLNSFNEENGTHIVPCFKVHFEPMGVYAGKKTSYSTGDTIVVPSDSSNYDRALALLEAHGWTGANIMMMEAQNIPMALRDCDFAVVNGNYALASEITDRLIYSEDRTIYIADKMANVIAIKHESEKIRVLVEALKQPNIEEYINEQFKGSVVYLGVHA